MINEHENFTETHSLPPSRLDRMREEREVPEGA